MCISLPSFSLSPVKKCEKCANIIKKHHSLQNSPHFFAFHPPFPPTASPFFTSNAPRFPPLVPPASPTNHTPVTSFLSCGLPIISYPSSSPWAASAS